MSHELTEADLSGSYKTALLMCAADDEASAEGVRVIRVQSHHKSAHAFVAAGPGSRGPTHVIKVDPGSWHPKREFEGLQYVEKVFGSRPSAGAFRLGAIAPVGYGVEPNFLVTRYQPGTSLRPVFDRAITAPFGAAKVPEASAVGRAMAKWLITFRAAGIKAGQGLSPGDYLQFCQDRADEIRRFLGAGREAENAIACARRYVAELSESDRELMAKGYPTHGDLSPQNLQVDENGVLYVFDLESFGSNPMNVDLVWMRRRLEEYALRGLFARPRARDIWREFWDACVAEGDSATFGLLCQMHQLLAMLAWIKNPDRLAKPSAIQPLRTRLRFSLWVRQRLKWLAGLTGNPEADVEYLRSSL